MKIGVIGAGPGGMAVAGHAGLLGFDVTLCDIRPEAVASVQEQGGIAVSGKQEGFAPISLATADVHAACVADFIILAVPGPQQGEAARALSSSLHAGQVLLVKPGGTGGALEVTTVLDSAGVQGVLVAETDAFAYGCKIPAPGAVVISSIKRAFGVAALPASATPKALERVRRLFPEAQERASVLHTGLTNINAIMHLAPMVTNAARIEHTAGSFEFYGEGISPSVARLVEQTDHERLRVAHALGVEVQSLTAWIESAYGIRKPTLYEAIQTLQREVYAPDSAPPTLEHRYLTEDVPCGAVPVADLGRQLGVDVSLTAHCVGLACALLQRDFWASGRTVRRLGLEGLSPEQIRQRVA